MYVDDDITSGSRMVTDMQPCSYVILMSLTMSNVHVCLTITIMAVDGLQRLLMVMSCTVQFLLVVVPFCLSVSLFIREFYLFATIVNNLSRI